MTTVSGLAGHLPVSARKDPMPPGPGISHVAMERGGEGPEIAEGVKPAAEVNKNDLETNQLEELANEINQALARFTSMNFQVDQEIDQVVVQVVDRANGDVVRQVPQEKLVELAKQMHKMNGMLFDAVA